MVATYRPERRLDRGGLTAVWLARALDGTAVALKLGGAPQPADHEDERVPGLVSVLEAGMSNGVPYQVMPLVQGVTLSERLTDGSIERNGVARVVASIARTLDALHALGRTHGDVRAANIILGQDGAVTLVDREVRLKATPERDRAALALLVRPSVGPSQQP